MFAHLIKAVPQSVLNFNARDASGAFTAITRKDENSFVIIEWRSLDEGETCLLAYINICWRIKFQSEHKRKPECGRAKGGK